VENIINNGELVEQGIERTGQNRLFQKTLILAKSDGQPFHGGSLARTKGVWKNWATPEDKS